MFNMTQSNVRHDLIKSVWHDAVEPENTYEPVKCVTWHTQTLNMTRRNAIWNQSNVRHYLRHVHIYIYMYRYICIHIYTYVRQMCDSFECAPWLIQMCAMTHSNVHQDLIKCATWLIQIWDMTQMCDMIPSNVRHDSVTGVKGLSHVCAMTQWNMRRNSWLSCTCDRTLLQRYRALLRWYRALLWRHRALLRRYKALLQRCRVLWQKCDDLSIHYDRMTQSCVWQDSFIREQHMTWQIHMCEYYVFSDIYLMMQWGHCMCAPWICTICKVTSNI